DGSVHRGEVRQVALYDLCAELPQGFGALVLTPNQGAHLVPSCEQEFGEAAANATHSTGCSGHEDRVVVFMFRRHVANASYRLRPALRKGALMSALGHKQTCAAHKLTSALG